MGGSRREFLRRSLAGSGALAFGFAGVRVSGAGRSGSRAETVWREVGGGDWGVEGQGWTEGLARRFDRFPERAKESVPESVWGLSRHSAGLAARFATDAPSVSARYTLMSGRLAMPHMPATGVSGLDLYARDEEGVERWLGVSWPEAREVERTLASGLDPAPGGGSREFAAYFPLYNGVDRLEIGVPEGFEIRPIAPRSSKPIVFYGTSILHGACASRPGMAFPSILGRRLGVPTINLGFSGSGRMDAGVVALLGELDAAAFVIDCLPNMTGAEVAERTVPLVLSLREARPGVPIVLAEDRTYSNARFLARSRARHEDSRRALREACERLAREGVEEGLWRIEGEAFLGDAIDTEGTTDGSHPNDLGMSRYADAYEPVLREALGI